MLIRRIIVVIICAAIPTVFCRHIASNNEEETGQKSTSATRSTAKRQLKKTHLRMHGKPPKELERDEGDSYVLECQAGGTPAPTIHWLKDGNLIPQTENTEEQPDSTETNSKGRINVSFTTSRLYLDCLSVEDKGEYTCVAENPYQRISASTTLTVLPYDDDEVECEKKSHGQAPRITFWTTAMLGSLGGEAKLACRAEGHPRPTIRWQGTQEEELSEDFDKYEILPEGDLIIKNLSWSDLGNYNCIAENVHGSTKKGGFLYPTIPDQ